MKIAIIQPRTSYYIAGSEKVSLKHTEFLSKMGHIVDFYTSKSKSLEESFLFKEFLNKKLNNVNIIRFDISESFPNIYKIKPGQDHIRWVTESIAFDEKIFDKLKKNKPDVILSYYLPDCLFKPLDIPNIVYLSGYPSQPITWYKSFIEFCYATISISSIVSQKWADEIQNVPLNYILSTGVDYPLSVQTIIKTKEKYNLVYAGRLIERKGVLTLVDAFKQIIKTNNDIHLWILGDGELKNILKTKIDKLNLSKNITMTGLVKNPYDYFTMADICIFPSHKGDGLMGTVLESMSAGKPVITTTNNGNEDVIIDGQNGIIIDPENIEAIVASILDLINSDYKRETMGKKAQEFIIKNITWDKNCKKLSEILTDVVQKNL